MKRCPKCQTDKPLTEFAKDRSRPSGVHSYCRACKYQPVAYGPRQVMYVRRYVLKKYGITQDGYDTLLAKQGGRCAICRTDKPGGRDSFWSIDHDHDTGKVRGLLCRACNIGIGNLKDDPWTLMKATAYLFTHKPVA